jgi:uncharacterized protein (DUF2252 family)
LSRYGSFCSAPVAGQDIPHVYPSANTSHGGLDMGKLKPKQTPESHAVAEHPHPAAHTATAVASPRQESTKNVSTPEDAPADDGRSRRKQAPRSGHADWHPSIDRRDPVAILIESSVGRVEHLLPIRYGRMLQSPFSFYRGAAAIMADDLAQTPNTGLRVQACGDCHAMNFGIFATPERRLIFDVNDFDETLPAPWEWDVKRLAASFVIAGRHNEFKPTQARAAALACLRSYREQMARYATMAPLDIWYESVDVDELLARLSDKAFDKRDVREIRKAAHGFTDRGSPKLLDARSAEPRIHDDPPLIYHPQHAEAVEFISHVRQSFHAYRQSLSDERRVLLDRYKLIDHAVKVVGVGSVGTRCGVLLLMAEPRDILFLQVKEARPSVLEPIVDKCLYGNNGQRVVIGQRLMQAASDLFLGWTRAETGRDFYVRQLRDIHVKPVVEVYNPAMMAGFASSCGWVLARAHARSGEPRAISAYLGNGDRFDEAVADFAESYADQNDEDFRTFTKAVSDGRLPAEVDR